MRYAHTVEQVRAAEAVLLAALPEGALMQRAATGLAYAVADYLGSVYGRRVLLLVGSGDNGGDTLYAGAQLARRGAAVDAILLSERTHPAGLASFRDAGGRVVTAPRAPEVVVDGIVGIGGSGGLRPEAATLVASLGGVPFVAVDLPSGISVDDGRIDGPHVRADVTVTFGTHKIGLLADPAAEACGAVHLVDIGLSLPEASVEALQSADVAALLPRPDERAHKYTRGVVGIRAGSAEYPGAAVLCVAGARTGLVGMVRYVGDASDVVRSAHPEVVGEGRAQAWVVGPGGGSLADAVAEGEPVVVDASALSAVTGPLGVPAVLTPHAGELAAMLGVKREEVEAEQLRFAREAAARFDAVVLLKGRHTLIATPDGRVRVTTVGPAWLATAGAGDVLAGLIGALLAAGLTPYDAASVGSWVHGAAATMVRGDGPIVAGEVAAAIPDVCARLVEGSP
ncbi:MAG TPA: NAD(P)H-hydrate dehydratase [Nocardioidaceae bacterium]|nr:NAD(P)H-hydrate dehydratase [Nocardioidaceae bacterium]